MTKVVVSVNGQNTTDVIAPMPQPVTPATAQVPDVGWVEISTNTIRGSIWSTGEGPPTDMTGNQPGDMYLDTSTGDIYEWNGETWELSGSFETGIDEAPIDGTPYSRQDATWVPESGSLPPDWADITGKPDTFPPELPIPSSGVTGLDAAQAAQDSRLTAVEDTNFLQDNHLSNIDADQVTQNSRLDAVETKNTAQDTAISGKEPAITAGNPAYFWAGDKTWKPVPTAGIGEAPSDFTQYARKNNDWARLTPPNINTSLYNLQNTTGVPLAAQIRTNTGSFDTATILYVADVPDSGGNNAAMIAAYATIGATITLNSITGGQWGRYKVSGAPTHSTGYTTIPVAFLDGHISSFNNVPATINIVEPSGGAAVYVSDTAPASPTANQLWFESDTGNTFIWYNDGNTTQWVQVNTPGGVDRITSASADLGAGFRPAGTAQARFILNDKADFTGFDYFQVDDTGIVSTLGNAYAYNAVFGSGGWTAMTTGYCGWENFVMASGLRTWFATAASVTAGGAAAPISLMTLDKGGTLTTSGNIVNGGGTYSSNVAGVALCAKGSGGTVYLQPNGPGNNAGMTVIDTSGNLSATGNITASGGSFIGNPTAGILASGGAGTVYLRPNGAASASGQVTVNNAGAVTANDIYATNGFEGLSVIGTSGTNPYAQTLCKGNPNWDVIGCYARHYPSQWAGLRIGVGAGMTFDLRNDGNAYKPVAGGWLASSDERVKEVRGNYEPGLAEVVQLQPVRFIYKGNDTDAPPSNYPDGFDGEQEDKSIPQAPYANSPHYGVAKAGTEYTGLIAQAVDAAGLGDLVKKRKGYIDGVEVEDLHDLDTSNLVFALVNAVKTLTARIEALEAARGV